MWSNMSIEEFREICATQGKDAAYSEIARRSTPMECMSKVAARHRAETVEKVRALVRGEAVAV
jgi:hypothetical protein